MSGRLDELLAVAAEAVNALLQQQTKNALAFGESGKILGEQSARTIHELSSALAVLNRNAASGGSPRA